MASLVKKLANRLGYEITRKQAAMPSFSFLETVLLGAMAAQGQLNIVQIGANDGKHSDPLNRFVMARRERTAVMLIEPQPEIMKYLHESYADHPNATIYNGAVGASDSLTLYRIRPDLWESFRVSYLKGAPAYCAPSGLTSANRGHVLAAARRHLDATVEPEDAIEELHAPCLQLKALLAEHSFPLAVHLLQVDAEGADDEVLYACNIGELLPAIINFESKHLAAGRISALEAFLSEYGYTTYPWNRTDTVALRLG